MEAAFLEKLKAATVLASAIAEGDDRRRIIHPSLWDVLFVQYDLGDIGGDGRHYEAPEFFEPTAIPLNVLVIPEWVEALYTSQGEKTEVKAILQHDPKYKHVKLNGMEFHLGDQQAKVIRFLHRKADEGKPWQHIKILRQEANIRRMRDTFGKPEHWDNLIRSDQRGHYRLRNEED